MSFLLLDFRCQSCDSTEEHLISRSDPSSPPPCAICGGATERVISAPKLGTVWAAPVSMGKSGERHYGCFDTRPIADGKQTVRQWKKARREFRRQESIAQLRKELG